MDPETYNFICNGLSRLLSAGMRQEALAFWAQYFPGVAMPTALEVAAAEGTLITTEMVSATLVAEELVAAEAALTLTAVEVDAAIALTEATITEAEWMITMRAAQAAAGAGLRASARWVPQGRGLIIVLALGMFAFHAATGARAASAESKPTPKKPDSIAACMRSLYALYVMKSMMLMLNNPRQKYRMYSFDEWRVQVFHPMLRQIRASAPERERLRAKARFDDLVRRSQRPDPWKI